MISHSFDYDASGKIKEEKGLNENLIVTNGEIISYVVDTTSSALSRVLVDKER